MSSMTDDHVDVVVGVDTHADAHHVAVIDSVGRRLGDGEFATTPDGFEAALAFATGFGVVIKAGVEGTGSYGTSIAAFLLAAGIEVVEVNRPDRAERRRHGKSDPTDAYNAAVAALSGKARAVPKLRCGIVESIRVIHVARRTAVTARTRTINQLHQMVITAPIQLREQLRELSTARLVDRCARFRPGTDPADPHTATKTAMRRLARRYQALTTEIRDADDEIDLLTRQATPTLRTQPGVGPDSAAKLLIAAADNPHRIHTEAAFAKLTGTAPLDANSGRITGRHRLNRGGDRQANNALHNVVLTRLRRCDRTRTYYTKRTTDGLNRLEIMRCLKRYVARDLYKIIIADLTEHNKINKTSPHTT